MDIYDISFIISTFWIGPFWFAMLLNPKKEKTKRLMSRPWFFLGPLVFWYILMIINPQGIIDFATSTSDPNGFIEGLAASLATKAGVSATWAHMVAGDIFVTRWIWKDGVDKNINIWLLRISIFFGVMLMPVGLLLQLIFRNIK